MKSICHIWEIFFHAPSPSPQDFVFPQDLLKLHCLGMSTQLLKCRHLALFEIPWGVQDTYTGTQIQHRRLTTFCKGGGSQEKNLKWYEGCQVPYKCHWTVMSNLISLSLFEPPCPIHGWYGWRLFFAILKTGSTTQEEQYSWLPLQSLEI